MAGRTTRNGNGRRNGLPGLAGVLGMAGMTLSAIAGVPTNPSTYPSWHLYSCHPLHSWHSAILASSAIPGACHSFRSGDPLPSLRPLPFLAPPAIRRIPLPLLKTSFFCFFENVWKHALHFGFGSPILHFWIC